MSALGLGLIAALAWGFHDICVRYVSQKTPLMASLLTVLTMGLAFHLTFMVVQRDFHPMPSNALALSMLAGAFFLIASLGLYKAFQRGPVRLVAPIIASFPILSVFWAASSGTQVSGFEWGAVLAIVTGVSMVAILSDTSADHGPAKGPTIVFSVIASIGFAGTFAVSQMAAEQSHHMPAALVTRVTAIMLLVGLFFTKKWPFLPGRQAFPILTLMGLADGIALFCMVSAGGMPNAQHAAVAASLFGMLTIIMAWAALGEKMTLLQWGGCAITFAGIGYLAS